MTFEERPTAKTWQIGERILDEFIRQKGYVPYRPEPGVPHPFDRLIASPDKRRISIVEVKTKCRREAYEDTGINQRHFDDYQQITLKYGVPLFLAFIDFKVGTMYGNWWQELMKTREPDLFAMTGGCRSYPWNHRGIVYFPLVAMRTLYVLTDAERDELRVLRTTNWQAAVEQIGL